VAPKRALLETPPWRVLHGRRLLGLGHLGAAFAGIQG
jgi:hypothetical protein